jgi:hypothetical protein
MLGNKEEFERRLQRMRTARVDGTFHGDKGRENFRRMDREGLEQGWTRSLRPSMKTRSGKRRRARAPKPRRCRRRSVKLRQRVANSFSSSSR